jgi:poly(3-hydroxybutyrate) depolymerase
VLPAIVFQGDLDATVLPPNGDQVATQWAVADDWADDGAADGSIAAAASSQASGQVPGGHAWDVARWAAPSPPTGASPVLIERWLIHGMGHAWPGGDPSQPFTDALGPDATTTAYDFFAAHPRR